MNKETYATESVFESKNGGTPLDEEAGSRSSQYRPTKAG